MRNLFILASLVMLLGLYWCQSNEVSTDTNKKDFIVQTQTVSEFPNIIILKKPGKIAWQSEVTVTAQAMGRVASIHNNEWQKVQWWQPVITLNDDIASYGLQLQKTKSILDSTLLNYEQWQITVDKSLQDAKLNLDKAQFAFETAQKTAIQTLRQAKQNLNNASLEEWTQSKLTLDKMISDIKNQIDGLKAQFAVQKLNLIEFMDDLLDKSDLLLSITTKYNRQSNVAYQYLWAKNIIQKRQVEIALKDLYKTRKIIENLNETNLTNIQTIENTEKLIQTYIEMQTILRSIQTIFENSITSSQLTQQTINWHKATFDWLQKNNDLNYTQAISYKNQVSSLLGNIDTQLSEEQQINTIAQQQIEITQKNAEIAKENADIAYKTTNINIENSIFNAELALKNAKLAYDTAVKNSKSQLNILNNSVNQSKISYQDSLKSFNKLSVRSPISGIISKILVDIGQEVNNNTPLFTVTSYDSQTIQAYISTDELNYLHTGIQVELNYQNTALTGIINSISTGAEQNLLYKVEITSSHQINILWEIVNINIPIQTQNIILPINIVTSQNNNKWYIYILKDNKPEKYDVLLWKSRGDKIEILSEIPKDTQIILNDIGNYDDLKFQIKVDNQQKQNQK